jgi:hypothetical protein
MKFVVDAHLPPGLCALLQEAGHDAGAPACSSISTAGHYFTA